MAAGLVGRVARARRRIGARRPVAAVAALVLTIAGAAALGLSQTAAAADGCHVSYTITGSWTGGFTANVAITNLGSPIKGWTLAFTLPGDEAVSQHWNAGYSQSGQNVTAADVSYNADLRTDKSISIGFNGNYSGGAYPGSPASFTLSGSPCTSAVSSSPAPSAGAPGFPSSPSAPAGGGPGSLNASGHLYESSGRFAGYEVGGYKFSNDEWGDGYDTQTLWVNSATDWGLSATQPNTPGVKSYAHIGTDLSVALDSLSSATSSFDESNPSGGDWESAYDLWLNGTGIEVMAWTYVNGDARPLGYPAQDVTLGGSTWTLYVGNNGHNPTYSFVRQGNETSGTVDLLSLLKYLEKTGGYFSNATLSSIQYGWEITGTDDVQKNFTMNNYSSSISSTS
ncbi:MAG TPA: cellulose binding domain-containing protein [Actinospica sp.]|nr:cellulose binding domain-containing protein [Actinospica sp.]